MHLGAADLSNLDRALTKEWLLADGAGGYASSTVLACPTRRYHGLWVPALRPPLARHVVLSHIDEHLITADGETWLSTTEYSGGFHPDGAAVAERFEAEPLPQLVSRAGGVTVGRHVVLLSEGDGVCIALDDCPQDRYDRCNACLDSDDAGDCDEVDPCPYDAQNRCVMWAGGIPRGGGCNCGLSSADPGGLLVFLLFGFFLRRRVRATFPT